MVRGRHIIDRNQKKFPMKQHVQVGEREISQMEGWKTILISEGRSPDPNFNACDPP
jgi:hypothetical protein